MTAPKRPTLDGSEPYLLLVEQIRDYAIYLLDRHGNVVSWNDGARRLHGYETHEVVGRPVAAFYPEEDAARAGMELEIARREGRVEDEGWRVRKDGTRFWVSAVITALHDSAGTLVGFGKLTRDLTERRRTDERMRNTEERMRLMVENVKDYAIFMLDPQGRIATWNIGAERIKGYRAEEIVGQHLSRFYPEEDVLAGKIDRVLETAMVEGRVEDEGWRVRKDGTRFWANVVITALRDTRGTLVGFAKITRDVTDRRNAEVARLRLAEETAAHEAERAARLESEKLQASLSTTLRSIGDAVIATDASGAVTFMNPVAETLTRWGEKDAVGRPLSDVFQIIDERDRSPIANPVESVLARGTAVALANHTILVARDGTWVSIDDSAAPIRGTDGVVVGVVLCFRDIGEKKRTQLRNAFLADASAVLAASLDGEQTLGEAAQLAVPRFADACIIDVFRDGQTLPERVGVAPIERTAELAERYPPRPATSTTGVEVGAGGTTLFVPLVARTRAVGTVTFIVDAGRTYGESDAQFAEEVARRCAAAVDNARLYASEQRARRAADVASRSKDEFLAMVSHELRTPLNAISGWAKMLSMANLDDARKSRAIETIDRNAGAMARLIEDLLDMSRIISGKMRLELQELDLADAVELAIESIQPTADARQVEIVRSIDRPLPRIVGDPARLQQVVWNLLSNAVKFSGKGGRVEVRVGFAASWAEIAVTDSGRGISADFLPFVFDAFRQEEAGHSRARGGLGLGLAITRQLVELHGGQIEVRSDGEGKGATFVVRLAISAVSRHALSSREALESSVPAAFDRPPELRGLRVLVVDDEEDARLLVRAVLDECGCQVTVAGSVDEALASMEKSVPDLVISDVGMPGKDGYELIRRVRALPPEKGGDVPAAVLTAYARAEDRRRMLNAGYSTHMAKPIEPAELVAVVASLVRATGRKSSS